MQKSSTKFNLENNFFNQMHFGVREFYNSSGCFRPDILCFINDKRYEKFFVVVFPEKMLLVQLNENE